MNSNCGKSNAIHPYFHGRAPDVANPVTHCALDLFERPSVLINYEGSDDQEVFPQVGCSGPQLDFVVTSDSRNLIDLNTITLDLECAIYDADAKPPAEGSIPVCFTNNTLHSLFSHPEVFLNEILVSTSNNAFLHSAFTETEMTTDLDSERTWAKTQGYQYQGDKNTIEEVKKWKEETSSKEIAQKTNSNLLEPLILISLSVKSFCFQAPHCTYAFKDRATTFPYNPYLKATINLSSLLKKLQCLGRNWFRRILYVCQ